MLITVKTVCLMSFEPVLTPLTPPVANFTEQWNVPSSPFVTLRLERQLLFFLLLFP